MDKFTFKDEILKNYQMKKLEEFINTQIEKLSKTKEDLKKTEMSNELFYAKCHEFVETINTIQQAEKEIKNAKNKEKGVK